METLPRSSIPCALNDRLEQVARGHRILEQNGHGDITLGHLSLRDPDGRGLWLKKPGRGLDEVFDHTDFVLIDFDGRRLENGDACHSEWPIHAEIMRVRPEIQSVGHTHPFHAVAFSAMETELLALSGEASNYTGSRLGRYRGTAGLINTPALARDLAAALGDAPVVLMKNHGITFVGHSLKEAVVHGIFIEEACRMQLALSSGSLAFSGPAPDDTYNRRFDPSGNGTSPYIDNFYDYYDRRLTRNERANAM